MVNHLCLCLKGSKLNFEDNAILIIFINQNFMIFAQNEKTHLIYK